MSGRVSHLEIPADDIERARAFHRDAFGWTINAFGTTPTEPGAIDGGMLARQGPIAHPIITVDVDDIDEALERIERLGGRTVVGRTPVADMGLAACFTDPEGNVLGRWQSAGS